MSEKLFCPPQPLRFWITPACAGKRRSDWIIRSIYWDHPRMCGEKKGGCATLYWVRGSPPRVQGKVHFLKIGLNERGITPAYAGKRVCPLHRSPWHRDHPRVCGEKPAMMVCSLEYWGSPPRMRGKDKFHTTIQRTVRITPACAGKSCAPQYGTQS